METGEVFEVSADSAGVVDSVSEGHVFVDGHGVGDVGPSVLDDRRLLSRNGFLVAVVTLDKYTGSLIGEPQIVTRGFVYEAEAENLLGRIKQEITKVVASGGSRSDITERLRAFLARFAMEETGRRPVVVPVVNKV